MNVDFNAFLNFIHEISKILLSALRETGMIFSNKKKRFFDNS